MKKVAQNSAYAWLLAARPKTLAAALMPVAVSICLAQAQTLKGGEFNLWFWGTAGCCLLFALLMQIAANMINDLYDFRKGTDGEDRLGPERACAQGWITPRAMTRGICLVLTLAAAAGLGILACALPHLSVSVAALIGTGVACMVFAFLYTTLLSYCGCGDVLVWAFFGFVPMLGTHYVLTGTLTPSVWLLAAATGLVTDTLLVVNNYRDRDTDKRAGKRTLIVAFGKRFGEQFYLWQGILGMGLAALGLGLTSLWPYLLYIILHLRSFELMRRIGSGRALNGILGLTAMNILVFGLCTLASLLVFS